MRWFIMFYCAFVFQKCFWTTSCWRIWSSCPPVSSAKPCWDNILQHHCSMPCCVVNIGWKCFCVHSVDAVRIQSVLSVFNLISPTVRSAAEGRRKGRRPSTGRGRSCTWSPSGARSTRTSCGRRRMSNSSWRW